MRFLAAYIMRGRLHAAAVAALAAAASLVVTPASYLSGAAVALVTLRLGPRTGLETLVAAAALTALLALPMTGSAVPGLAFVPALWLPLWALAWYLRRTVSPGRTLVLAGLLGVVVVAAVHGALDDPAGWWQEQLTALLQQLIPAGEAPPPDVVAVLADLMTGAMAAGFALSLVAALLLARWWQALLYNPGGFRAEFHRLRLGPKAAAVTAALLLGATAAGGVPGDIARDLAMVAMALHVLQGLAVIHGVAGIASLHTGWLVAVYALLVVLPAQTALALALGGVVDNWFDFRGLAARRLGSKNS